MDVTAMTAPYRRVTMPSASPSAAATNAGRVAQRSAPDRCEGGSEKKRKDSRSSDWKNQRGARLEATMATVPRPAPLRLIRPIRSFVFVLLLRPHHLPVETRHDELQSVRKRRVRIAAVQTAAARTRRRKDGESRVELRGGG